MSAGFAGCPGFRQCFAAFRDLILHCWRRQRRRRTASPSQAYFFFFSSLSPFRAAKGRGGNAAQRTSVPICSFLPPAGSSLSSSEKALPRSQESHSLIGVCGVSLLGAGRAGGREALSPPLSVEHTLCDFSVPSQQPPLPSHSLPESKDFSRRSLIPVCFSSQAKGNQQATHGWMCRSEGGGGGGIKRKGEPPSQSSHTHTLSLSLPLEGKQSLHSQGWAVKCLFSFYSASPSNSPASQSSSSRKENLGEE